jgi:phosphopantetheine adenylyltransferase
MVIGLYSKMKVKVVVMNTTDETLSTKIGIYCITPCTWRLMKVKNDLVEMKKEIFLA